MPQRSARIAKAGNIFHNQCINHNLLAVVLEMSDKMLTRQGK